jgi:phospholipase/carboxylesterase
MDVLQLGPLRARRVVKTTGTTLPRADATPLTVVLMHGYGAPGDDLVSLSGMLEAPAGTTFVFPEAPSLAGDAAMIDVFGDARAWWPIDVGRFQRAALSGSVDDLMDEVPPELAPARESLVAMLDALERETGTPSERVVLGGFSQGSMLALDVALRTKRPLAGLVLLSGTLLAKREWVPLMAERAGLKVFQSHGTEDPILPYRIAEKLRHALEGAGMRVSFTRFEGGHGIPPQVMRDFGTWLRSLG